MRSELGQVACRTWIAVGFGMVLASSAAAGTRSGAMLDVVDVNGRVVRTLPAASLPVQAHSGAWTPFRIEAARAQLPAGFYFARPAHAPAMRDTPPAPFAFEDATDLLPRLAWSSGRVRACDVDGDGRTDLVFSTLIDDCDAPQYPFRAYVQKPWGAFADETAARVPFTHAYGYELQALDVDGDGDLDVVLGGNGCGGSTGATAGLYVNDGHGRFADESAVRLPVYDDFRYVYRIAAGRFFGSALPDLAVTLFGRIESVELWRNDGAGRFHPVPGAFPSSAGFSGYAVTAGDLEGDGRDDVAVGALGFIGIDVNGDTTGTSPGGVFAYRNAGDGTFVDETASRMPAPEPRDDNVLAAADVDQDGDLDLVDAAVPFGSPVNAARLLVNDGAGHFTVHAAAALDTLTGWFENAAFGRVDGDAALDLFLARVQPGDVDRDVLLLGDGAGGFTNRSDALPDTADFTTDGTLADVDRDGDLDLVTANCGPYVGQPGRNGLDRNRLRVAPAPDDPTGIAKFAGLAPNPVSARVAFTYTLLRADAVRLAIYDVRGRRVRELVDGGVAAGEHVVAWDARDERGVRVEPGLYFGRISAAGRSDTRRLVVVR